MGKAKKQPQGEDYTGEAIKTALTGVVGDAQFDKVRHQIRKNLEKAAKSAIEKGETWQDMIERFVESFCSSTIGAYQKERWFQSVDLSPLVQEAVFDLLPAEKFWNVNQRQIHQFLLDRLSETHGRIEQEVHIDHITWETAKEFCEEDHAMFKKMSSFLRKAWTNTRDEVLSEMVQSRWKDPADLAESFARKWIKDVCGRLSASVGSKELQRALPPENTTRLFNRMFQRSALPTPITDIIGPPPKNWRVVTTFVRDAYFENDSANAALWSCPKKRKASSWNPEWDHTWEPKIEDSSLGAKRSKLSEGGMTPGLPGLPDPTETFDSIPRCPECNLGKDCVGSPYDDLWKFNDEVWCSTCWGILSCEKPDVEGELILRSTLPT